MIKNTIFIVVTIAALFLGNKALLSADYKEKWVVITSINLPTEAVRQQKELVRRLSGLFDWQVVVVGDKKTPQDWHWPNCIYLSPEQQMQLGYRITTFLPWNHYSRKAVGYLYAIQHGAKVIYDTDDDNILLRDFITCEPKNSTMNIVESDASVLNAYAYFGQSTVWPRGYPLKKVLSNDAHTLHTGEVFNIVQQGLVNEDPDVDAIFRLTRGGEINFEQTDSISYQSGTMCPFNSQNTVFYYEAFWGLLLPITTSFRVCDIWRGYCTQRLLWDIGAVLSFTKPTVCQKRNEHDLLRDFVDEIDLYTKADKLVHFLVNWKSEKESLPDRIIHLMNDMVTHHFYKSKEVEFTQAWLLDLADVGYIFPALKISCIQ